MSLAGRTHGKHPRQDILTLWRRQQMQADLLSLLDVEDGAELKKRAGQMARAGHDLIPILLRNLDTDSSHLLAVLARCAVVFRATRSGLRCSASFQTRTARSGNARAAHILAHFVGENEEEFVCDGADECAAVPSFCGRRSWTGRKTVDLSFVEYLQILDEQPTRVVLDILGALQRWPGDQMVEPLCLLAQDRRPAVAQEALRCLGQIRQPRAAQACSRY